jgi:hypothetical protein
VEGPKSDDTLAREERWRRAPVGNPQGEIIRHGDRAPPQLKQEAGEWTHDANDTDCRGVASKVMASQFYHKAQRVPELKEGYCRRNTCECCAPEYDVARGRGGNMCSCRAHQDGLCRRCWLDFFRGKEVEHNQYYGPK